MLQLKNSFLFQSQSDRPKAIRFPSSIVQAGKIVAGTMPTGTACINRFPVAAPTIIHAGMMQVVLFCFSEEKVLISHFY